MMIERAVEFRASFLVAASLFLLYGYAATQVEMASARKVAACHIEQFGVYHALAEISEKTGIPIGVDAVQPEKEQSIMIDFPGGTLADLLNEFVSQAPDYRWADDARGIIRVSRTGAHVTLLDVVMAYGGADRKTRQEVWKDIADRPEVTAWMEANHCSRREFFHGREFKDHNDPISLAPGSLTLAELLDEVAVKSGENRWAVLQSPPDHPCTVAIILW